MVRIAAAAESYRGETEIEKESPGRIQNSYCARNTTTICKLFKDSLSL